MQGNGYTLKCTGCGREEHQDHHQVKCPDCGSSALLRAVYRADWNDIRTAPGSSLWDFAGWLPVRNPPEHWKKIETGCFRSEWLGHELGLDRLWIIFSGYWPERGANLVSLSFKQLDAETSAVRIDERDGRVQIASSAGNLGLAIAQRSISRAIPAVVLVPYSSVGDMQVLDAPGRDCLCLVAVEDAVYGDVIALTDWIDRELDDRVCKGGGVYNVATRGGHSVTVLNAFKTIGAIPDHYFQAVGSGTGAIAAWESVQRCNDSERTSRKMRLHLVQNHPFTPMVDAWRQDKQDACYSKDEARQRLAAVKARVLSNNSPPWGIAGGIRESLSDSRGRMYAVTNDEIEHAMELFERLEGCDINPAAGAALAGLIQATREHLVDPGDRIALHITGGGRSKLEQHEEVVPLRPSLVVSRHAPDKALDFIRSFLSG